LNQKILEQVAKLSAETAVQAALDYLEKEKQKQQKVKKDWRLRNTKLLLKHYRSFVKHSDGVEGRLTVAEGAEAFEDLHTGELAVEAIKRSKQRTLAMVRFIQRMMYEYKGMCEASEQPEEQRRFQVIHTMYISEEKMTAEQIAKCHSIDSRTVYRDINEAVRTLSVLVFGVDAIEFT
jgi:flavin-dependent dehydrogenase